jgi:hypothetical protein
MKKILIASAVAMLLPSAAFADIAAELATAQTHAGLAAKAPAIDGIHMHMHHALNCLEGPNGADFDKTNMNPCAAQGNGAIPDGSAAQKAAPPCRPALPPPIRPLVPRMPPTPRLPSALRSSLFLYW